MQKAHVPTDVRQRLLRLRDMYSYWLRNPKLGDRHILAEIKRRNGLADTQAYEDLRLLKLCLGNLQQMTRDWYQYLFITRCEEGFQMARDKGDAGAFAKVLASLGKFTRLDHEQLAGPDYSQIIPQQFELTSDPAAPLSCLPRAKPLFTNRCPGRKSPSSASPKSKPPKKWITAHAYPPPNSPPPSATASNLLPYLMRSVYLMLGETNIF